MSFLNESYLGGESYLGVGAEMPAPDQSIMPPPDQTTLINAGNNLIQIPFTDIVITKQTALLLAAVVAVGAWYFFVYKKE